MIYLEIKNQIGTITFDNKKGNMLNYEDLLEFDNILDNANSKDDIKGLIMTGLNQSFCTGINLSYLDQNNLFEEVNKIFALFDSILVKLISFKKPLIAAVNGHAIGAGFLIMLCADFRYSNINPKIKYGLPEINYGLSLDELMLELVLNSIGQENTRRMILKGELLNCDCLNKLNIIDDWIDPDNNIITFSENEMAKIINCNWDAFLFSKKIIKCSLIYKLNELLLKKSYSDLSKLYYLK